MGRGYISSYPASSTTPPPHHPHSFSLSVSLSLGKSLFLYLSVFLPLIFLRDNCVQALSSFSSLKRRLPSRHRGAESAFRSSMMSRTPRPHTPRPTPHTPHTTDHTPHI